jgi:hypothetical protein
MTKQQLLVEAIHLHSNVSAAFHSFAAVLEAGQTITLADGRTMTQQQVQTEAAHLDKQIAQACHALGETLAAGQTIKLRDGRDMTRDDLLACK